MAGTFAPDLALHTDQGTTSVAELMHTARPVLLDLADRQDLREAARGWRHRVDVHTARTEHRPADALLTDRTPTSPGPRPRKNLKRQSTVEYARFGI